MCRIENARGGDVDHGLHLMPNVGGMVKVDLANGFRMRSALGKRASMRI